MGGKSGKSRSCQRLALEVLEPRVLLNGAAVTEVFTLGGDLVADALGRGAEPASSSRLSRQGGGIPADRFEDNDTPQQAPVLGTVGGGYPRIHETGLTMDSEDADAGTPEDYYWVYLAGDELEVSISFRHSQGDLDLYIYDDEANLLDSSESVEDEESVHLYGLERGFYLVDVYGYDGTNPNYALEVIGRGGTRVRPDRFEENDTLDEATFFGIVGQLYPDIYETNLTMDTEDAAADTPEDYYLVYLAGDELEANIYFTHALGDLDLYIYDSAENVIGWSEGTGDQETVHLTTLASGYYYVDVYGFGGTNPNYTLEVIGSGGGPLPTVTVTEATSPFIFDDSNGDEVYLSVVGDGQMRATATDAWTSNPDLVWVEVAGGNTDSQFLIESDYVTDGVSVGELDVNSFFDVFVAEGGVGHLDVPGRIASTLIVDGSLYGGRIRGDVRGHLAVGSLEGHLVIDGSVTTSGEVLIGSQTQGEFTVSGNLKGDLTYFGAATGPVTIEGDIRSSAAVAFGAGVQALTVGGNVKAGLLVNGNLGFFDVGGSVYSGADIDILGTLGEATIGRDLKGTLTADALSNSLRVGRDLRGNSINLVGDVTGDIFIGRDLRGALRIGGNMNGDVWVGDDIQSGGRITVGGGLAGLHVADDIKSGPINTGQDLTLLEVGDRVDSGVRLNIAGDLVEAAIGGDLRGRILTGNLGTLDVGGNLRGALRMAGSALSIAVSGNIYSEILVMEDLNYLGSASQPVLLAGPVPDYVFLVNGHARGSLTVLDTIGLVEWVV